ncbi:MAG: hypothetical protein GY820_10910 [Gammaproteobacteria bacterium]|nr:hypothetical protein [Gammaproteobacteria bacterium]
MISVPGIVSQSRRTGILVLCMVGSTSALAEEASTVTINNLTNAATSSQLVRSSRSPTLITQDASKVTVTGSSLNGGSAVFNTQVINTATGTTSPVSASPESSIPSALMPMAINISNPNVLIHNGRLIGLDSENSGQIDIATGQVTAGSSNPRTLVKTIELNNQSITAQALPLLSEKLQLMKALEKQRKLRFRERLEIRRESSDK